MIDHLYISNLGAVLLITGRGWGGGKVSVGIEGSDGFQGKRREDPLLVVAEKEYKGGGL